MLRTYLPCSFILCSIRSFTIGTHPPQPVPAFVHFLMASMESQLFSFTAVHILSLLTLSQLQINASSGKLITPAPLPEPALLLAPNIISSGSGGSTILFLHVCNNILYCVVSPTRMPPSNCFPSALTFTRL